MHLIHEKKVIPVTRDNACDAFRNGAKNVQKKLLWSYRNLESWKMCTVIVRATGLGVGIQYKN